MEPTDIQVRDYCEERAASKLTWQRNPKSGRKQFGHVLLPDGTRHQGTVDSTLRNVKGGEDRTSVELFIAGVRGWDAGLRSFLVDYTNEE
jgi:hypothetical protein